MRLLIKYPLALDYLQIYLQSCDRAHSSENRLPIRGNFVGRVKELTHKIHLQTEAE